MRKFLVLFVLLLGCSAASKRSGDDSAAVDSLNEDHAHQVALAALVTYPSFKDSDPVEWSGRTPQSYPIHGIDVSRWQGEINWAAANAAGVSFAYIKATEGGDVLDVGFRENWRLAGRAGMPRGAYHYYYFCRSPESQARWFITHVPKERNALPPVLDLEWNHHSKTCKRRPTGAQVRREAERFLRVLERHYGVRPLIYTTVDFWRDTGIGRLRGTQFWLRSVADHPSETYPGAHWLFWQYSGTGRVQGIEGDVDLNVFRGSPNDWVFWSSAE